MVGKVVKMAVRKNAGHCSFPLYDRFLFEISMIKKYFILFIFSFSSLISVIVGMCMYAHQHIEAGSIPYIIDIREVRCFQFIPYEASLGGLLQLGVVLVS